LLQSYAQLARDPCAIKFEKIANTDDTELLELFEYSTKEAALNADDSTKGGDAGGDILFNEFSTNAKHVGVAGFDWWGSSFPGEKTEVLARNNGSKQAAAVDCTAGSGTVNNVLYDENRGFAHSSSLAAANRSCRCGFGCGCFQTTTDSLAYGRLSSSREANDDFSSNKTDCGESDEREEFSDDDGGPKGEFHYYEQAQRAGAFNCAILKRTRKTIFRFAQRTFLLFDISRSGAISVDTLRATSFAMHHKPKKRQSDSVCIVFLHMYTFDDVAAKVKRA